MAAVRTGWRRGPAGRGDHTLSSLAAADGAAGWCAAIGMGSNLVAGYLPRAGAEEVFATGDEIAGGSLMPAGRARRT